MKVGLLKDAKINFREYTTSCQISNAVQSIADDNQLFENFPDRQWLLSALIALYAHFNKNNSKKRKRQVEPQKCPINSSPSVQTPHVEFGETIGPHPLLPLDVHPQWKDRCPAKFPKGLKTLEEALSDDVYLALWNGRLPEVVHEVTNTGLEISGMLWPIVRQEIGKIIVGEGGRPVLDRSSKESCAGKAMYQLRQREIAPNDELYVLRNVNVPAAREMYPKPSWTQGSPVCKQEPEVGLSFIAAPKGCFTDLHNGTLVSIPLMTVDIMLLMI